jgi:hypothetical protein
MSEEKSFLEILQEKISNPIWLNEQESEFAEALKTVVESFKEAARQNILMVNLFNEYGYAMNGIFASTEATASANQEPTQTIEPNRAERRATKRRTPLNLAE